MQTETNQSEALRKSLFYERVNGYDRLSPEERDAMEAYCAGYRRYLDAGKTERECVTATVALARAAGFQPYVRGMSLKPGARVYRVNREKSVMLAVIGMQNLEAGLNIAASHLDCPRLDLKPNPLYESEELALLKTHYYGGLRKYQWVGIPLELRGVVIRKDGSAVPVSIGSDPEDPIFAISDLLPHLATEQNKLPLGEAFSGEHLNILAGSRPYEGEPCPERVKLTVLALLNRKYAIREEDFLSAELTAVPAFSARETGFDRSLLSAYGQDDRVCAYAALTALFSLDLPSRTALCMLADKEEVGSEGVSGMQSAAFDTFVEDLCEGQGVAPRVCLERSFCLSADVTAAFDPNYPEVFERRNSALLNYGLSLTKYTGSRGKRAASDAAAELVASVRRILDDAGVIWQMNYLGKVDVGGSGTVAKFMADRNIDTLDAGVPLLSMHAPYETSSKLDCYMTFRGIQAIFERKM